MPSITLKNVSKQFRVNGRATPSLLQFLRTFGRNGGASKPFEALRDVSLEIGKGEKIGLIGKNGAGKTTLMRLIHGIYAPDRGTVSVEGKVVGILQLGIGLVGILSVRDNIYLYGTILGLSRDFINENYERILSIAELEKFENSEVRQLSTGMRQRLAFAVAIMVRSDVLLLDEVLAVGDESFRNKCYEYLTETLTSDVTVVYASHNLASVQQYFPRTIWLENGMVVEYGPTESVLESYMEKSRRGHIARVHAKTESHDEQLRALR